MAHIIILEKKGTLTLIRNIITGQKGWILL
jgi:hypothetical protein